MESIGEYTEAEAAYEVAKDFVSVIRLNLDKLNNTDKVPCARTRLLCERG